MLCVWCLTDVVYNDLSFLVTDFLSSIKLRYAIAYSRKNFTELAFIYVYFDLHVLPIKSISDLNGFYH